MDLSEILHELDNCATIDAIKELSSRCDSVFINGNLEMSDADWLAFTEAARRRILKLQGKMAMKAIRCDDKRFSSFS